MGSDRQRLSGRVATRSAGTRRTMQANRGRDTSPELAVRSLLHAAGFRFRVAMPSRSIAAAEPTSHSLGWGLRVHRRVFLARLPGSLPGSQDQRRVLG